MAPKQDNKTRDHSNLLKDGVSFTDIGYLFWQVLGAVTSICPPFPVSCTSLLQPHIFKCLARGSFPPRWWLLGVVVNHWWHLGTKVELQVHSHHRLAKMLERSDATLITIFDNSNSFKIYCAPPSNFQETLWNSALCFLLWYSYKVQHHIPKKEKLYHNWLVISYSHRIPKFYTDQDISVRQSWRIFIE